MGQAHLTVKYNYVHGALQAEPVIHMVSTRFMDRQCILVQTEVVILLRLTSPCNHCLSSASCHPAAAYLPCICTH